jgi:hypothetical protein
LQNDAKRSNKHQLLVEKFAVMAIDGVSFSVSLAISSVVYFGSIFHSQ